MKICDRCEFGIGLDVCSKCFYTEKNKGIADIYMVDTMTDERDMLQHKVDMINDSLVILADVGYSDIHLELICRRNSIQERIEEIDNEISTIDALNEMTFLRIFENLDTQSNCINSVEEVEVMFVDGNMFMVVSI